MIAETTKTRRTVSGLSLFHALKDYAGRTARGRMLKNGRLFPLCVRASLAKCYEFNAYIWDTRRLDGAFFCLPTLRGICEEVIVLNYARRLPVRVRDDLFPKLMAHDVYTRAATQEAFFAAARPLQPVLRLESSRTRVHAFEDEIRGIWRAHGWPNMTRGVIPPIRQLAEREGGDVLATLYEYLYRLTSGTVHFSVGALLRTGWGSKTNCTFSVRHLNAYYSEFGRIYGAFLFCVYFELFGRLLRPGKAVRQRVGAIREFILSIVRWPEMITFEEMNLAIPDPGVIINALSVVTLKERKRLLTRNRRINPAP